MGQKTFQELDLTDAFLFAAALEDPETCQMVVEIVLGRPVGPVKVQVEKSLLFAKDFRYVRFDVFYSGKYRYTFREICQETGEKLGDGSCKIFLSTVGTNEDEVPAELIHLFEVEMYIFLLGVIFWDSYLERQNITRDVWGVEALSGSEIEKRSFYNKLNEWYILKHRETGAFFCPKSGDD